MGGGLGGRRGVSGSSARSREEQCRYGYECHWDGPCQEHSPAPPASHADPDRWRYRLDGEVTTNPEGCLLPSYLSQRISAGLSHGAVMSVSLSPVRAGDRPESRRRRCARPGPRASGHQPGITPPCLNPGYHRCLLGAHVRTEAQHGRTKSGRQMIVVTARSHASRSAAACLAVPVRPSHGSAPVPSGPARSVAGQAGSGTPDAGRGAARFIVPAGGGQPALW
jgi:hypothetical protein